MLYFISIIIAWQACDNFKEFENIVFKKKIQNQRTDPHIMRSIVVVKLDMHTILVHNFSTKTIQILTCRIMNLFEFKYRTLWIMFLNLLAVVKITEDVQLITFLFAKLYHHIKF